MKHMIWEKFTDIDPCSRGSYNKDHFTNHSYTVRRTKVPNGWLVHTSGYNGTPALSFVPDPNHLWLEEAPNFKNPENNFFDEGLI